MAVVEKKETGLPDDLNVEELLGSDKVIPDWAQPKPLERAVHEDWVVSGGIPEAQDGFRKWAQAQGLTPETFGETSWDAVRMLTLTQGITGPADARRYFYSRKYSGSLTPRMFASPRRRSKLFAPTTRCRALRALSGHSLYFPSAMPLDMFALAADIPALMPGISDWMSLGGWRWTAIRRWPIRWPCSMPDGARARAVSYPMMHCVWPMDNSFIHHVGQPGEVSQFCALGPSYMSTEVYWNHIPEAYVGVHNTTNRAAQVDDILCQSGGHAARGLRCSTRFPPNTGMAHSSFDDKRAAFLGLSHGYFQPEMITEDQIADRALQHYDALYVLDDWSLFGSGQDRRLGASGRLAVDLHRFAAKKRIQPTAGSVGHLSGIEREFSPGTACGRQGPRWQTIPSCRCPVSCPPANRVCRNSGLSKWRQSPAT